MAATAGNDVMDMTSEAIERAALFDLHAAASREIGETLDLRAYEVADALVSVAGRLPDTAIVINRALGFTRAQLGDEHLVARIAATYRGAGIGRYFIQVTPDALSASLARRIAHAGLDTARGWQKFRREPSPAGLPDTDFRVEEIGPDHGGAFARIVCAGFDLGEIAEPWLARLPGRENWHVFMTFDGDTPVGTGAMYVDGGVAWTDWGATAPAYRGRGSQGLLLAARIGRAHELGCASVHTCTGEAVPAEPQHSWNNIVRHGFAADYVRANYAPPRK
jgi:GNAT superfamily N-acetyltransferase